VTIVSHFFIAPMRRPLTPSLLRDRHPPPQVDVTRTKNVALIRKLVKVKGMPNNHCHSKDGANALVECCKNGSIEGFKAILTAGANIDSPNKKGPRTRLSTSGPALPALGTGFAFM
jgi:hypothetical protein